MKASFTYFKRSGKYYTCGDGLVPDDLFNGMSRDRICPLNGGGMPGISGRAADFYVAIDIPEGYPFLLHPETQR